MLLALVLSCAQPAAILGGCGVGSTCAMMVADDGDTRCTEGGPACKADMTVCYLGDARGRCVTQTEGAACTACSCVPD